MAAPVALRVRAATRRRLLGEAQDLAQHVLQDAAVPVVLDLDRRIDAHNHLHLLHRASGKTDAVQVTIRIDTPIEVEYYRHGGIMPYVLRQIARKA